MMSKTSPELKQTPRFTVDAHGKPIAATMDMAAYVTLLIKANAIDLALWPPGMEKGAEALARIRQIESDCTANHGEFDWEKLPEETQDEYDRLCLLLDELRETGTWMTWSKYKAQREESRA
jgi:hypothetical protein